MSASNEVTLTSTPVIQAPMAGVQNSALTIAVSNAGGLGSLPCAMLDTTQVEQELSTITAATSEPYNINFFCHPQPVIDEQRYDQWIALLAPYFSELGIEPPATPAAASRQPFSHDMADVIEPFRPPVVSFHFGLPAADLLRRVKGWGSRVWSSATTVDEAQWLAANGADAIIAQGIEAGGHRGMFLTDDVTTQCGTFALLPQIVNAVDVPVIAAGGIAGQTAVQAALSMGAAAVQCGTSYLLCSETNTSDLHRTALKDPALYRHTALTNVFSGRPARGIVNRLMSDVGPDCALAPAFPLASIAVTALRSAAEAQGSSDFSSLWCGQNANGCEEISAAEMTKRLASL